MDGFENVIIVDNGRFASKMVTPRLREFHKGRTDVLEHQKDKLLIPAVVSPGRKLKMDIDLNSPDRFWVEFPTSDYFVGNLALDQGAVKMVNRTDKKDTEVDKAIMLCNLSLVANNRDELTLITNCPARDWTKENRKKISQFYIGDHVVKHRAGVKNGTTVSFSVKKVHVLPEGAGAFYSFIYDDSLKVIHPEYQDGLTLVIEIGDQTTNYLLFKDGAYQEDSCGSIEYGLYRAHRLMQKELEEKGVDMALPEISSAIIREKNIYFDNNYINAKFMASNHYETLSSIIYNGVIEKVTMRMIRNVLVAGGGAQPLIKHFEQLFGDKKVDSAPYGLGQWLNADGFGKMYMDMLKSKREG